MYEIRLVAATNDRFRTYTDPALVGKNVSF